ncbi:MAG: NUDIX hydrolase [Saprospiraceae bacterium]
MKDWTKLRSEAGPDLKLFRTRYDWMQNPRNGHVQPMLVVEGRDAVQVVAETVTGEILLVRQYRFGTGAFIYELPGGALDSGEAPAEAARRELSEETGYQAAEWMPLGRNASNPVFMSSYIHHYLARGAAPEGEQVLDLGEDISVVTLPVQEVWTMLMAGAFDHPHTVCGLLAYFAQRGISLPAQELV